MKIKLTLIPVILLAFACQNAPKEETKNSNEAIEATTEKEVAYAQKIELKIEGMTCTGCENAIQKTIDDFDGVYFSKADHEKGIAILKFDSTKVDVSKIEEAITELGYEAKGHVKLTN